MRNKKGKMVKEQAKGQIAKVTQLGFAICLLRFAF